MTNTEVFIEDFVNGWKLSIWQPLNGPLTEDEVRTEAKALAESIFGPDTEPDIPDSGI